MTAREPSAVEVIAEHSYGGVLGDYEVEPYFRYITCRGCDWTQNIAGMNGWKSWIAAHSDHVLAALKAAGFVVATRDEIRAMSVQEQAELIGGEVEWGALGWGGGLIRWGMTAKTARRVIATLNRESGDDAPDVKPTARSVGPWREVQP